MARWVPEAKVLYPLNIAGQKDLLCGIVEPGFRLGVTLLSHSIIIKRLNMKYKHGHGY